MPSLENVNQWESKKTWSISDYGVHPCILDKLRLHNFIQDMEKVRSLFQLAWNFLITRHWSKKDNAWISRTLLDKWKIDFWLSVNFIAYIIMCTYWVYRHHFQHSICDIFNRVNLDWQQSTDEKWSSLLAKVDDVQVYKI